MKPSPSCDRIYDRLGGNALRPRSKYGYYSSRKPVLLLTCLERSCRLSNSSIDVHIVFYSRCSRPGSVRTTGLPGNTKQKKTQPAVEGRINQSVRYGRLEWGRLLKYCRVSRLLELWTRDSSTAALTSTVSRIRTKPVTALNATAAKRLRQGSPNVTPAAAACSCCMQLLRQVARHRTHNVTGYSPTPYTKRFFKVHYYGGP